MERGKALFAATTAVCQTRAAEHGDVNENFQKTADLWTAYIGELIRVTDSGGMKFAFTAKDVAMLNILQKVSRSTFNEQHADHYVDMAGYAALAAEVTKAE